MIFSPEKPKFKFLNKRVKCPAQNCGSSDGFAPLKGYSEGYGYCHACGYKRFPIDEIDPTKQAFRRQFWALKNTQKTLNNYSVSTFKTVEKTAVDATLERYFENYFFQFLTALIGATEAENLLKRRFVGTGANGAAVFWHADATGNFRYGKQILFDPQSGKKSSVCSFGNFNAENGFRPCLFGENQLSAEPATPVIFVESEKNAILGELWARSKNLNAIFLATGGTNGLTESKAAVIVPYLKNRKVLTLFDADDAGRKGAEKVKNLLGHFGVFCKPLDLFPNRTDGYDLGDAIIDKIKTQNILNLPPNVPVAPLNSKNGIETYETEKTPLNAPIETENKESKEFVELNETQNISNLPPNLPVAPSNPESRANVPENEKSFVTGQNLDFILESLTPLFWTIEGEPEIEGIQRLLEILNFPSNEPLAVAILRRKTELETSEKVG